MKNNFDRNKMIAQIAMLEKGVVPMPSTSPFFGSANNEIMLQIRNQLNTLPEDERLIAKRKFRKMHRKVAKEMIKEANRESLRSTRKRVVDMNMCQTVDGCRKPTARTHVLRNREVWSHMIRLAHEGKI